LGRPRLLLLDEPTAGADPEIRSRLLEVVRDLTKEGTAVCYTTHYLNELEALDAEIAMIDGGRIIAKGRIEDLIKLHGRSVVELRLEGQPPPGSGSVVREDGEIVLRVPVQDAAAELVGIVTTLAPRLPRIRRIDIVRPSLESVFLALTGRSYRSVDGKRAGGGGDLSAGATAL
jgi:ABC-2 type transport system ATP-binding protein